MTVYVMNLRTDVSHPAKRFRLGRVRRILLWLLAPTFGSSSALNSLSLRSIDMVSWDPALVICLCTRSYGWSIGSNDRDLVSCVHLL